MAYDGREIANFILDYCDLRNRQITHLSLQKILFFCHIWSLIDLKQPLIKHNFEAWQHGPVLQYIYREFKVFGNKPITGRSVKINKITGKFEKVTYSFDENTEALLKKIVEFYSRLSASDLRNLSHINGGPWDKAWNHQGLTNPGMTIGEEQLVDFYSKAPPFITQ